jgi:hypothetical protein
MSKSKKDRQDNDQKKKDKRTNNDVQNTTQKNRNQATHIPLKLGLNSCALEGKVVPAPPIINNTRKKFHKASLVIIHVWFVFNKLYSSSRILISTANMVFRL